MVAGQADLYAEAMADDHHSLRVPRWLWSRYAEVVGNIGRAPDLKRFMAWRLDDSATELGPDVEPPHDFTATFRVPDELWNLFAGDMAEGEISAELRRYIWWRVQHPKEPLPGRRLPPLRRSTRHVACV